VSNDGQPLFNSNNYNTVYHPLSERKIRLPTNESGDSCHSSQYNYVPNPHQNLIGVNLNQQFSANANNMQLFYEDEYKIMNNSLKLG
jgi:hypothetical protein